MTDIADPAQMTPEERLVEVVTILALCVLRLHRRAAAAPGRGVPIGVIGDSGTWSDRTTRPKISATNKTRTIRATIGP